MMHSPKINLLLSILQNYLGEDKKSSYMRPVLSASQDGTGRPVGVLKSSFKKKYIIKLIFNAEKKNSYNQY